MRTTGYVATSATNAPEKPVCAHICKGADWSAGEVMQLVAEYLYAKDGARKAVVGAAE